MRFPVHGGETPACAKQVYVTPRLVKHGDMRALTQGAAGVTKDGNGNVPKTKNGTN